MLDSNFVSYQILSQPVLHYFLDLNRVLTEKMEQEIPIITVVAVIGTTEESAVDPLTEILDLKQELRKKVSVVPFQLETGKST